MVSFGSVETTIRILQNVRKAYEFEGMYQCQPCNNAFFSDLGRFLSVPPLPGAQGDSWEAMKAMESGYCDLTTEKQKELSDIVEFL